MLSFPVHYTLGMSSGLDEAFKHLAVNFYSFYCVNPAHLLFSYTQNVMFCCCYTFCWLLVTEENFWFFSLFVCNLQPCLFCPLKDVACATCASVSSPEYHRQETMFARKDIFLFSSLFVFHAFLHWLGLLNLWNSNSHKGNLQRKSQNLARCGSRFSWDPVCLFLNWSVILSRARPCTVY